MASDVTLMIEPLRSHVRQLIHVTEESHNIQTKPAKYFPRLASLSESDNGVVTLLSGF